MGARYYPRGKSWAGFAPSISSLAAPTTAELLASLVLTIPSATPAVSGLVMLEGFETSPSYINVPDVASRTTARIPGEITLGDCSGTFYDEDTGSSIRAGLVVDTPGYAVLAKAGWVAARRCEVWPVVVASINDSQIGTDESASTFTVAFAQTAPPIKNAVLPATS